MFLGSYLQQSSEQRQKRNDPSQRGVSLSEAIKGRGVLKKSLGPVKEEGSVSSQMSSLKLRKLAPVVLEVFHKSLIWTAPQRFPCIMCMVKFIIPESPNSIKSH